MATSVVTTGVDRLARQAPKTEYLTRAPACRCVSPLVLGVHPHCLKCGRDTEPESMDLLHAAWDREGYALLDAAIEATRRELDRVVFDHCGCTYGELMVDTYWARDFARAGRVPG